MRKRIDTCNSNTNEKSPNDTKIEDLKSFKVLSFENEQCLNSLK